MNDRKQKVSVFYIISFSLLRRKAMKLKGKIIIGAMVLAAISGMQSMAQNVYELTPVLVTANRYSTPDLKIPAATEVFTQEKIKQLGAQTVMDVVKNIPGFSFTASPTGNQYVGFRGLGRNYTAILVNGIPLGQDANYDLDAISTDTIERIEVVKGGSTVQYGSSAMAGVINIITKKESSTSKVVVGGGDQHKLTGSVDLGLNKLAISYNHSQQRDFGKVYTMNTREGFGGYIGDKQKKDSLNVQYALNEDWTFQYMYTERTTDCSKFLASTGAISPGFHSVIKYNFAQMHYAKDNVLGAVYYRNRDWKYNTSTHQKGNNYGFNLQNRWDMEDTKLTAGVEYERESTKNNTNVEAGKRNSAAVFVMTDNKINEHLNVLVGAREAYVEKSGSKLCPQFQILWTPAERDSYYVNINRSMRAPNVYEQWGSPTQLMNPDLKAESGWNYEMGWKKLFSQGDYFKVDLFHMKIDDRISSRRVGGLTQYYNVDAYKNTGVEVSYESNPSSHFMYNVGMSYANPKQKKKGLWERTEYKLGANWGLGYKDDVTQANLTFNYYGKRSNDVDRMLNLDLSASRKLSANDTVHFYVYNLLGRDDIRSTWATSNTGSLLPERNWLMTFEHKF